MDNRRNNGNWLEAARNAASGYAVIVLGAVCFVLALAVIATIVRIIVGTGAGTGA